MSENKSRMSFGKLYSKFGIYIILLVMIIVLSIVSPFFFSRSNIINVLRQATINGTLALGVTLIIITGGIDLSVGGIMAFAGVIATSFAHTENALPLGIVILIGILVGTVFGALNGVLVSFTKITPFIVTLGVESIVRGLCLIYTHGSPVTDLDPGYKSFGQGTFLGIPILIYVFTLVTVITFIILHSLKFGRHILSVGGNEMAARVSGINVKKTKLLVYMYAGALYGLVGVMLASRTNAATPNAGTGYELDAISAVVIGGTSMSGGKGTIPGTIVGVLILGILSNGMDILNVSSYIQQVIKGVIIIGAVMIDQAKNKSA